MTIAMSGERTTPPPLSIAPVAAEFRRDPTAPAAPSSFPSFPHGHGLLAPAWSRRLLRRRKPRNLTVTLAVPTTCPAWLPRASSKAAGVRKKRGRKKARVHAITIQRGGCVITFLCSRTQKQKLYYILLAMLSTRLPFCPHTFHSINHSIGVS